MSDGSLATKMEDWLIDKIKAVQFAGSPLFNPEDVKPWDGAESDSPTQITMEFIGGQRDRACGVLYLDDRVEDLADGQQDVRSRFVVLVGCRNQRPAEARRGTATSPGTNVIRDLLRYALHDQRPEQGAGVLVNDGTTAADLVDWRGTEILINNRNFVLQQHTVEVREVPIAGG